jgi:hypothetical protein
VALDWILCSREDRLPQIELLTQALAPASTAVTRSAEPLGEEALRVDLAFEKNRGTLEFRLTPEGIEPPSEDLSADVKNDLSLSRVAARLSVDLPRGRERHGVLWAIRVAGVLAQHLDGPVLDLGCGRAWRASELEKTLVGRAFDVRNHMRLVSAKDEAGRLWLATFGLEALGQPDLLVPGVRPEDEGIATALLAFVADQEIGRARLEEGTVRGFRRADIAFVSREAFAARHASPPLAVQPGLVIVPAQAQAARPQEIDRLMAAL